jgi:hypothetical protein
VTSFSQADLDSSAPVTTSSEFRIIHRSYLGLLKAAADSKGVPVCYLLRQGKRQRVKYPYQDESCLDS